MSDETRGHAIKARRLRLGIVSLREFADKSGIDRQALGKAEQGQGSPATYERAEAWLDRFEEETGHRDPANPGEVAFELHDVYGVGEIIVKGPVDDIDQLKSAVADLLREMRAGGNGK